MSTALHILNVGRGACTVIEHPSGRLSMVDVNVAAKLPADERLALAEAERTVEARRREAALTHPVTWYLERFSGRQLFRFINSHPDIDHLLGVAHLLNGDVPTTCFWDLPHHKSCSDFLTSDHEQHWRAYVRWREGNRGKPFRLWQWQGADSYWFGMHETYDHIEVLWPTPQAFGRYDVAEDWNNMSVVLRAWHAGRSVLLPGDIESPAWRSLAAAEDRGELKLSSDVLIASHHGRLSGYPPDGILNRISPRAVIVSTDKLPTGHNAARLYSRVADVFATRWYGDLSILIGDNKTLEIWSDSECLLRDARRVSGPSLEERSA